jgi:short-subunit dehydrogenase
MTSHHFPELTGKVIWLTGASTGIGEAVTRALARQKCSLILTARNEAALREVVEKCSGSAATLHVYPGDITDAAAMKALAIRAQQEVGDIDILLGNAGTHIPTNVENFAVSEYATVMNVNYYGALNCIEAVLPTMLKRKSGYLAMVSSVAGYRGLPRAAAYGASKSALTHFLESIRFDLEPHGVAVTVISPGFVKTPLTDKNDFSMPFLIDADTAAAHIVRGLARRPFEIHFPWQFTFFLKLLRVLPYPLYHVVIKKIVLR